MISTVATKKKSKKTVKKRGFAEERSPPPPLPATFEDEPRFYPLNTATVSELQSRPLSPPPLTHDVHECKRVATEESIVGPSSSSKDLAQLWTSPYTEGPANLFFGSDETAYFVPLHFIPYGLVGTGIRGQYHFPDVDAQTGHTLVHYLYKETYETTATDDDSPKSQAHIKFRAALLVFVVTSNRPLAGLQRLAVHEMSSHGLDLTASEILDIADVEFPRLHHNSWVHGYLFDKIRVAFDSDRTAFTNGTIWEDLKSAALIKFIMGCVVEIYDTRLSDLIDTEQALHLDYNAQKSSSRNQFPSAESEELQHTVGFDRDSDEPIVKHCCEPDDEHAALSDDFSTISCPHSGISSCNADLCLYEKATEDCCQALQDSSSIISAELCEPSMEAWPKDEPEAEQTVPGCLQELPQLAACKNMSETLAEASVDAPTECEAAEAAVEAEILYACEIADSESCALQAQHVLEGNGWKSCAHCRAVVEALAMQV